MEQQAAQRPPRVGRDRPVEPRNEMDLEEFRRQGYAMIDWIVEYQRVLMHGRADQLPPVQSQVAPGDVMALLPSEAPEQPESFDVIREDAARVLMPGVTHWGSPNFFAFFPANTSPPAILGELMASGIGMQGMLWVTSPACTELELAVLDWMAKALALPKHFLFSSGQGIGTIQGTASESVIVALCAARKRVADRLARDSASPPADDVSTRLTIYVSDQTHSSVQKAAMICGIPLRNLRIINTDTTAYSLTPALLQPLIEQDIAAGLLPCFVCVTVGTTSITAVDDVAGIAELANQHGIWCHLDAAFAGTAALVPEYRYLIAGVENVSSFNFNPHKWMLTNFDCSLLWVRDRAEVYDALTIATPYMRNPESDSRRVEDLRNYQIPLGRRARAIKLWFVLRSYGLEGIRNMIREHYRLAEIMEDLIASSERFELVAPRTTTLLCFRATEDAAGGKDHVNQVNQDLLVRINKRGVIMLTPSALSGKAIIRFSIGVRATQEHHVRAAWLEINQQLDELLAERKQA